MLKSLDAPRMLTAMFGMAGPIACGVALGHGRIGIGAALGGLALSGGASSVPVPERVRSLLYALIAGGCAVFVGSLLGRSELAKIVVIPVLAACATLFGSISRPLVRATTQFVLLMIISGHTSGDGATATAMVLLFMAGGLWTGTVSFLLGPLFRIGGRSGSNEANPSPRYSMHHLTVRWKRSLTHLTGWQYTLRISACLVAAQFCGWLWPHHHAYWVAITVVIVVQRDVRAAFKRTVERAAGTTIGALLAGLVMLLPPSPWTAVIVIAVLAAARPALIGTNYTAYAAVMTPLVILLLDFGRQPSGAFVYDRLAATLVGCILALTLGFVGWHKTASPAVVTTGRPLPRGGSAS